MSALPYQINIHWEELDAAYVAIIPALSGCVATGDTPEEAAREILVAAELWLQATAENGKPIPPPDLIPFDRLQSMKPVLNLNALAREADISVVSLSNKLNCGTELTKEDEAKLSDALSRFGLLAV